MIHSLKIAPGLSLPLELVTQTLAILAQKRKGKSYLARRIVEQLHVAGQQVVVVDPKGDWWGLRLVADGKHPGLPIVIVGGERGDIPLETGGGEVVAKLVVEERVSVLLDLSLLRKHEVATFMTAFLENLYRMKAREIYRTPVMLVIDEADAVAPQKPQPNQLRMLGVADDIVRRGGQRGIGCMLITQRSAVLNKDVLSQIQVLVALCTIAPQDLKALEAWIDVHGTPEQRHTLMESLPSLPRGDAWWWSPGWPTDEGIFTRKRALPIETFDSGATPKPGEKRAEPKQLADVDLEALKRQMAATIARAEAEDPKKLRARVAELERQLVGTTRAVDQDRIYKLESELKQLRAIPKKIVERSVVKTEQIARLERVAQHLSNVAVDVKKHAEDLQEQVKKVSDGVSGALLMRDHPVLDMVKTFQHPTTAVVAPRKLSSTAQLFGPHDVTHNVTRPQQKILGALAWYLAIGVPDPSRHAVAFIAGVKVSGSFNNNLGALRTAGFVNYPKEGCVLLTPAGEEVAPLAVHAPTLAHLHDNVREVLTRPQVRIFDALLVEHPSDLAREDLAKACGVEVSGSFNNNLGAMRTARVVDYPSRGRVCLTEIMFPPGLR